MQAQPFSQIFRNFLPAGVPQAVHAPLAHALGVTGADALYRSVAGCGGNSIPRQILEKHAISYRLTGQDVAQIPPTGPAVLLANHPHGILDAALLASLLLSVRSDIKFLANPLLSKLEDLKDLIIPIDPFGKPSARQGNSRGLRQALQFLEEGGLLVIFPAGEVSHFDWQSRTISDPPWQESVARLLRIAQRKSTRLPVIPAFVEGRNSIAFQGAGLIHPRLRSALLLREFLAVRDKTFIIRLGRKTSPESVLAGRTDQQAIEYLRWRTDLLGAKSPFKARTNQPLRRQRQPEKKIVAPLPASSLAAEIDSLAPQQLLATYGPLAVYTAAAAQIPAAMAEIARLREVTFRAAGEGTGQSEDRDAFDELYEHLFVWNRERKEIAGAYRICSTGVGVSHLYTATLFRYNQDFLDKLGPALELGRSFIRPEYQKDFAPLLLLWKGIGKLVARNPRYKTLFGPVSISNQYQPASRQIIASFLRRFAWFDDLARFVSSRHPFVPRIDSLAFDMDELSTAISDIEQKPGGVPVLLRHYLKLGGKLLGFNVDPQFANVVDGLIVVDLTKTEEKLLERYLGKEETKNFLRYHAGIANNGELQC